MISNLLTILLSIVASLVTSVPEPQLTDAPHLATQDGGLPPDPAGGVFSVEVNGQPTPAEMFYFDDGTWMMVADGNVVGFGFYEFDGYVIEYVNLSSDGGGGQTGVYSWTGERWVRTWASHPKAPQLSLVPIT